MEIALLVFCYHFEVFDIMVTQSSENNAFCAGESHSALHAFVEICFSRKTVPIIAVYLDTKFAVIRPSIS